MISQKQKLVQTSRDALWKGIIGEFFEFFLRYFYPDHLYLIDFSKGFQFLDKELTEIQVKSKGNQRYVDVLVKVFLYDGSEEWILFHIEVQGQDDPNFQKRMFIYFYRIFDKYRKRVAALAILTGDEASHPKKYETSFLDTKLTYEYGTYKLREKTLADFQDKDNPVSIIMEVAWQALKRNKLDDSKLYDFKINLVRRLKALNYDSKRIRHLLNFIKRYSNFENSEISLKFENESHNMFNKEITMGLEEAIWTDAKMQGKEEGKEEGIVIGVQQTEQKFDQERKLTILSLREKSFSDEEIAETMRISIEEMNRLLAISSSEEE